MSVLDSDTVKRKIEFKVSQIAGKGLFGKLAGKVAQGTLNAVKEMRSEEIEKGGAILLDNQSVQDRLLQIIDTALNSRGITVTLNGIEIDPKGYAAATPYEGQLLTPELETAVIHAISEYLKQSISDEHITIRAGYLEWWIPAIETALYKYLK